MAGRKEYELLFKLKAALGSGFTSAFKSATGSTKELQSTLKTINSLQGKVDGYKRQSDALENNRKKLSDVTEEYEKLKKEMDQIGKPTLEQVKKFEKAEKQVAETTKKVSEQEEKLQSLGNELKKAGLNTDNLSQQNEKLKKSYDKVKQSQDALDKIAKAQDKVTESANKTKKSIVKTIGVVTALAAALYSGPIQSSIEFESAFAGVTKTIEATPQQLTEIRKGIRKMATEIPSSVVEISAVAEAAGQLGIHTPNVLKFTRVMADLGVATNLTGDEAATTLAKFANITGMDQNNFDKLGSTIVALGNNMATTEADIAAMALRLAGAGSQVGLSEAQILSFSGALSSVGIEAEAGGTAFSKVMKMMQLAVETGNGDLIDFAKVSGLTSKEFKEAFQKDAAGAMISFIQGLGKSNEKGMSAIKILDDMGIKEARMSDALLRASQASGIFAEAIDLGNEAWKENKALTNEANQRYATTESSITILKNAINDIGISIGNVFLPHLASAAKRVSELALKFSEFAEANPELIKNISKVVVGLLGFKLATSTVKLGFLEMKGGFLAVEKVFNLFKGKSDAAGVSGINLLGKLRTTGAGISKYFGGIGKASGVLKDAFKVKGIGKVGTLFTSFGKLGGSFLAPLTGIAGKLIPIIGVVTLIISVIQILRNNIDKIREIIRNVFGDAGVEVFDKFIGFVEKISNTVKAFFSESGLENIKVLIDTTFANNPALASFLNSFVSVFHTIGGVIGEFISFINTNVTPLIASLFSYIVTTVLPALGAKFVEWAPTIQAIIVGLGQAIQGVISFVVGAVKVSLPVIKVIFENVFKTIGGLIEAFLTVLKGIINFISGVFSGDLQKALEGIKDIFVGIFEGIKSVVSGVLNFLGDGIKGLFNKLKGIDNSKVDASVNADGSVGVKVKGFAKGTRRTPDTFIAGERGAELITNARNRAVFTAAQTKNIFSNMQGVVSAIRSAGTINQFQPAFAGVGGISAPSIISRQNSEGIIIKYAPVIHASAGSDTNEIERILDENNRKLLDEVEARQRKKEDNERRQSYE